MKYTFHIVDVFSSTPFGGNQLAILPDAAGISTEGMQKIARGFNSATRLSSCRRTTLRTRVECASTSINALRSRMPLMPTRHWKHAPPPAPPSSPSNPACLSAEAHDQEDRHSSRGFVHSVRLYDHSAASAGANACPRNVVP